MSELLKEEIGDLVLRIITDVQEGRLFADIQNNRGPQIKKLIDRERKKATVAAVERLALPQINKELKVEVRKLADILLHGGDEGFWVSTVVRYIQSQRKTAVQEYKDTFTTEELNKQMERRINEGLERRAIERRKKGQQVTVDRNQTPEY